MAEIEEGVCEDKDWLERVGFILEGQGVVWLLEEAELIAGGGGRPGVALIGGGRRGRSFVLEGLGDKQQRFNYQINIESSLQRLIGRQTPIALTGHFTVTVDTYLRVHELGSVQLSYRGGRGGSEEFAVLLVSGLGRITGLFLRAGAGAACFRAGSGPGGLGGAGFSSGGSSEAPVGLGARFGAGGKEQISDSNSLMKLLIHTTKALK